MGMFGYPTQVGFTIANLKPGDEVTILEGEGYPPTAKETTTLIAHVSGYSALTIDNIAISCRFNSDLIVTGKHLAVYQVSPEAQVNIDAAKAFEEEEDALALSDDDLWEPPDVDMDLP